MPAWPEPLNPFLVQHSLCFCALSDIVTAVDQVKQQYVVHYSAKSEFSSLTLYRTLQPDYQYAEYLLSVIHFSNRRLLSRFRFGCHCGHVDTGRWVVTDREKRLCQVCHPSDDVEDEQHLFLSAQLHSDIRNKHASLFQNVCTVSEVTLR